MKLTRRTAIARLRRLSVTIESSHLEMGDLLCLVQGKRWWSPYGSFRSFVEAELSLKYRKAAALCATARKVKELRLSRKTVTEIGWSKMMLIAPRLGESDPALWLDLAKRESTATLTQALRGETGMDPESRRARMFYLTEDENDELIDALAQHGLERAKRGYRNKEAALMALVHLSRSTPPRKFKKAA